MIASTMQDRPLGVQELMRHGARIHARSTVATFEPDADAGRPRTFAEVAQRAERLAAGLIALGVRPGDRVATLSWNHDAHLEAYLAVPSIGAVLHTLNFRLGGDQLGYIVEHAGDVVVIADASLVGSLLELRPFPPTIRKIVLVGGTHAELPVPWVGYEELLGSADGDVPWPTIDDRSAAAMCYTTGTTGRPKGVVYSHRSIYLHSLACCMADAYAISERDRLLVIVPMFHANGWGLPYAAWLTGADLLLPGADLSAGHLTEICERERATFAAGVPTIWEDVLSSASADGRDLSSLRMALSGGSALPAALVQRFAREHGVPLVQGWGLTETSPLAAMGEVRPIDQLRRQEGEVKTGRPVPGVELRVVDEAGTELAWDGASVGEFEVRGPWVTGSYYRDPSLDRFRDGWLRTGDVGHIDEDGYMQITDRLKDVIKSGGEWVSSVALEDALMSHDDVCEACVIGVPDERWQERPLACVVLADGASPDGERLRAHLAGRVARWWVPERWAFVDEIPRTSVGKFDKRALRAAYDAGRLDVKP